MGHLIFMSFTLHLYPVLSCTDSLTDAFWKGKVTSCQCWFQAKMFIPQQEAKLCLSGWQHDKTKLHQCKINVIMHFHSCLYWQLEVPQPKERKNQRILYLVPLKRRKTMALFWLWKKKAFCCARWTPRWPSEYPSTFQKGLHPENLSEAPQPCRALSDVTWDRLTGSWAARKCPFYRLGGSWTAAPTLSWGTPRKLLSSCISTAVPHQPPSIKRAPCSWLSGVRDTRGLTWLGYGCGSSLKWSTGFCFLVSSVSNSSSQCILFFIWSSTHYLCWFLYFWRSNPSFVSTWRVMPCMTLLGLCINVRKTLSVRDY